MTTTMLLALIGGLVFIGLSALFVIVFIRFCGVKKAEYLVNEIEHRQGFTQIVVVLVMLITCGVYLWQGSIASDTEKRELRAYLHASPEGVSLDLSDPANVKVSVFIEVANDGQTPANRSIISSQVALVAAGYDPIINITGEADPKIGLFIGAHTAAASEVDLLEKLDSDTFLQRVRGASNELHLWAHIQYTDVFNETHYLRFCIVEPSSEVLKLFKQASESSTRSASAALKYNYDIKNNYEY